MAGEVNVVSCCPACGLTIEMPEITAQCSCCGKSHDRALVGAADERGTLAQAC